MRFQVRQATGEDLKYAGLIAAEISCSAKQRSTGISHRTPGYIQEKIRENKAMIAYTDAGKWAGFCYLETWTHKRFVATSGLIVNPVFRHKGLARQLKQATFDFSRKKYPKAKIFGLTSSPIVKKINTDLGFQTITYSELAEEEAFWKGYNHYVDLPALMRNHKENYLCTAMLYDPKN